MSEHPIFETIEWEGSSPLSAFISMKEMERVAHPDSIFIDKLMGKSIGKIVDYDNDVVFIRRMVAALLKDVTLEEDECGFIEIRGNGHRYYIFAA